MAGIIPAGAPDLRTASPLSYVRVMGRDPMVINKYYDLLERTLADNDLLDKPAQIFNLEETGMPFLSLPGCHSRNEESQCHVFGRQVSNNSVSMLQCVRICTPICHSKLSQPETRVHWRRSAWDSVWSIQEGMDRRKAF